jgi:hypothetical protein
MTDWRDRRPRRASRWRVELRIVSPVMLLLAGGTLASPALYDRNVWDEVVVALAVATVLAVPFGVWMRRDLRRRLPVAEPLPPDVPCDTARRTGWRMARWLTAYGLLLAFFVPTYEGDIGEIGGLILVAALVAAYVERSLARWEDGTGARVWSQPKGRGRGDTLYIERAEPTESV